MSAAKSAAKDAIANEKARKGAQKTAWKDMGDGKRARNTASYGDFSPAIIWVIGGKVYASDGYKADIVEITGAEADKFISSSEGAAAIAKQSRAGFGSVSPMDVEIPSYLTGAPAKGKKPKPKPNGEAQTYDEWMGFK